jgi:adenine-specific DNA-methyltransferase
LNEVQQGIVPPTWWPFEDCGHNDEAQKETGALIGKKVFSTPKPIRLLDRIISIGAPEPDAIVMDFFAGSGSIGHAVMAKNSVDNSRRRFVLVQLPEPLDENNKDQKVAAELCDTLGVRRSIAELTKERLRRAAHKIRAERPSTSADLGFRVFRLDKSNIRGWIPNHEDLPQTLLDNYDHILGGRSEADIAYELLLKLGLDLCVPIQSSIVTGKTVNAVGGGVLILCLADNVAFDEVEELAAGISAWHKELAPVGDSTVVFRDSAFADDVAKTNMAAILAQNGLENVRSL